jgi:crossover junction endodeoxyribonuclease RuvC
MDGSVHRLREAGTVRSRATDPLPRRLVTLYDGVSEVIRDSHPELIAIEELYSEYRFPRTALLMAHARGAICLAAAHLDVPVVGYPPSEVKNAVAGFGRASKEQMQQTVQRIFGLPAPPQPNDVADALALAITGCYRRGNRLTSEAQ